MSPSGRPMSVPMRLSTFSAGGVNRRIRSSRSTMTIGRLTPWIRLDRSSLSRPSSTMRVPQLVVDGGQLLVGRVHLLLGGLELLVGALELLVDALRAPHWLARTSSLAEIRFWRVSLVLLQERLDGLPCRVQLLTELEDPAVRGVLVGVAGAGSVGTVGGRGRATGGASSNRTRKCPWSGGPPRRGMTSRATRRKRSSSRMCRPSLRTALALSLRLGDRRPQLGEQAAADHLHQVEAGGARRRLEEAAGLPAELENGHVLVDQDAGRGSTARAGPDRPRAGARACPGLRPRRRSPSERRPRLRAGSKSKISRVGLSFLW